MNTTSMGWIRFTRRVISRRPVRVGALGLLLVWLLYSLLRKQSATIQLGGATFSTQSHQLVVKGDDGKDVLTATLGLNFDLNSYSKACSDSTTSADMACVEWDTGYRLKMSRAAHGQVKCYDLRWETLPEAAASHPLDCVDVGRAHWYGGAEVRRDRWTLEKEPLPMQPYLPSDVIQHGDRFGSVMERYWLSSAGAALYVDDLVPLHVGVDRRKLCFQAKYDDSPYQNPTGQRPVLAYQVCVGANVKVVHRHMAAAHWPPPSDLPDVRMLKFPIWSTWARYKTSIDQEKVMAFAQEISGNGFLGCQIEIDDMYTPTYGDFVFDPQKFPDPNRMSKRLHNMGFKVTAWTMPFHNTDSQAFADGLSYDFFLKAADQETPALVKWWQGIGAVLDVTKEAAVKWFGKRLQHLRDQGVDSFKFDAGEVNWLPRAFRSHAPLVPHVHHYTRLYAESVYQLSDNMAEVRAAYRNQRLPVFVRMMDKLSRWDYDLGLKTLIPTALTFGILGYPFVLPDMVGGNAYDPEDDDGLHATVLPEKELFIRWLQVSAFLPSMQLSISPWQFDAETVEISKAYVRLHETYVYPKVLQTAQEAVQTGNPIVRPLWWVDPEDSRTHNIDSEFLIGDDLLVAPILDKGATQRNIFLPSGRWMEKTRGQDQIYDGGRWIWDYQLSIKQIAYFERVS